MKLKDALENYQYFSGKASELVRQLGFAGIAIIWIFKATDPSGKISLPDSLLFAGFCLVVALALDFLHYVYASAAWGFFHRYKESQNGVEQETEFDAPVELNWPHLFLFWMKILAILIAYFYLLKFWSGTIEWVSFSDS